MLLRSPPNWVKMALVALEHAVGAFIGTALVHWVIGRAPQDLVLWITDVGLYPWSFGIAFLIITILIITRMVLRFPRFQWLLMTLTLVSLIALVYVAVALAPECGAFMRLQVRSVAPELTGGCIGSYSSNGSAFYKFEIEQLGRESSYRVMHVELRTVGAMEEQYEPNEAAGLDFNSGIFIALPGKQGQDFSLATYLRFEIKGKIGPGGLGIGAKDADGREIKLVKLRNPLDRKKLDAGDWETVSVSFAEFERGNFQVNFSRLSNISFFTTNKLSGFDNVNFKIKNIRIERE